MLLVIVEKILFGLPPTVTVVNDNDSILDAVRRNSTLPGLPGASGSTGMRASLSVHPPLITHTDATPQSSPNDGSLAGQQLLKCPPFKGDTTLSPHSLPLHQVMMVSDAAFTPDTCSPDTSYIHLYPLVSR